MYDALAVGAGLYRELAAQEEKVSFGGRLGEYRYYDMDNVVKAALEKADDILHDGRD